jgi:hypothetical protein
MATVGRRTGPGASPAPFDQCPAMSRKRFRGQTNHLVRGELAEATMGEATRSSDAPLLDLALESWRFQRLFLRALAKLDAGETARFASQHSYFVRRLEECLSAAGLRFVTLEGQPYVTGTAARAVNMAEFGPDDDLVVDQMIEPIVMSATGLLRPGTVLLRKADE